MGSVVNLTKDLVEIFDDAQRSSGTHQKSALKLKNLYDLVGAQNFHEKFKKHIDLVIMSDSAATNPYVDRFMKLIGLFCFTVKKAFEVSVESATHNEEFGESPLLENFFEHILARQDIADNNIRLSCCQLITNVLDQLVGTDLSSELCEQISSSMLERLIDNKLEVRIQAILALHRFQETQNKYDKIIGIFKILMEEDRFAKIRRLCVEKIALREDVVPFLLMKIRDVDVGVKLAAYTKLYKIPGSLKTEERRLVIRCASFESSDKIKRFIKTVLIPYWLSHFDNNVHLFMKALRLDDTDGNVKETNMLCEFILSTLFKTSPLDVLMNAVGVSATNKLIPYEDLNWETCNYWRILVQYIRENSHFEEGIGNILPELTHFCTYIQRYCDNLPPVRSTTDFVHNQFILRELFTIAKGYDTADPIGRSALTHLVRNVIMDVVLTADTVQVIISNLESILPDVELRARFVNGLISEISYPKGTEEINGQELEYEQKISALREKHNETSRHQSAAISKKDYLEAGRLEDRLREIDLELTQIKNEKEFVVEETPIKKQDIGTLIKKLDIAAGLLLSPQIKKMTSSLETLKTETIFELMIHENDAVQAKAFRCYSMCCIIDKKTASDGIHLFSAPISAYQSGQECDIEILLVCISAIVDLLRIFGTQLIAAPEDNTNLSESQREDHQSHFFGGTSLTNLIQGLVDLMDDEQIQIQETAGRGLCCLILTDTIKSASLLSRLVLKWCQPDDQSQKLKQLIGVILQQLAKVRDFYKQWENTILITLKALANAPDDSPHHQINIEDIAKFMLALYETNLEQEYSAVWNFAMRVCLEIKKKPRAKQVFILSKILNMLKLQTEDPLLEDLLTICEELQDSVKNSTTRNNITKFLSQLSLRKRTRLTSSPNDENDSNADDSDSDENKNARVISMIVEEE